MDNIRAYRLNNGDMFSIDLNSFMSNAQLWTRHFEIMGFDKYKRKWWKFWKPKWTYYVKLMFLGGE